MRRRFALAAAAAALLLSARTSSAAALIELRPSTTTLVLGEPAPVEMTARYPQGLELSVSTPALDAFALLGWSAPEIREEGGERVERRTLTLLPLDLGAQTLPAMEFELRGPGGRVLKSPPVKFDVLEPASVRQGDKALRDLKPYWLAVGPSGRRLAWLLLALLAAAGVLAAFLARKKKEARAGEPALPPHLQALQALEDLERTALASGAVREFYERLSSILREYLQGRFGFPALFLTTRDLVRLMRESGFDRNRQTELRLVLGRSDLVKFAKEFPLAGEPAADLARVRAFVEETAPKPAPAEAAA